VAPAATAGDLIYLVGDPVVTTGSLLLFTPFNSACGAEAVTSDVTIKQGNISLSRAPNTTSASVGSPHQQFRQRSCRATLHGPPGASNQ